jgi:hypothetical protein
MIACGVGMAALLRSGVPAHSQNYYFTEIAQTVPAGTYGITGFGQAPGINAHGDVAFVGVGALPTKALNSVYIGDGISPAAVVMDNDTSINHSSGIFPDFFDAGVSLNDAGIVAFAAPIDNTPANGQGVYKSAVGPLDTVATIIDSFNPIWPVPVGFENDSPHLNNIGEVSLLALYGSNSSILRGNGASFKTIAQTGAGVDPFSTLDYHSMNSAGTVAFRGYRASGTFGVYTGTGGTATTQGPITAIVTSATPGHSFASFWGTAINDAGDVAFVGDDLGGATTGVYTWNHLTLALTTVVAGSGLEYIFGLGMNNHGDTAYLAERVAAPGKGTAGIYAGASFVADKVVELGDPLFGSTLSQLPGNFITYLAFNDYGQIAFWFQLADGREGIARANRVDVTSQLTTTLGAMVYHPASHKYTQKVQVKNLSKGSVQGPISLVLDSLSGGVLVGPAPVLSTAALPPVSSYVNANPASGWLAPGKSVTYNLVFTGAPGAVITYTPRLLAGPGPR